MPMLFGACSMKFWVEKKKDKEKVSVKVYKLSLGCSAFTNNAREGPDREESASSP